MKFDSFDYHFSKHVVPSKEWDYFVIPYSKKGKNDSGTINQAKEVYKQWAEELYNEPVDNKDVFGMYLDSGDGDIRFVKVRKNKHPTFNNSPFEQLKYSKNSIHSYFPCDDNVVLYAIKSGKWKLLPVDDNSPSGITSLLNKD